MNLLRVIPFAHSLLEKTIKAGDSVVDATAGNGHDTLFLANLVGANGTVFSFDVQEQAINNTKSLVKEHTVHERVQLFLKGHENVKELIPKTLHQSISAAVFNLGYLPGSDKTITTKPSSTIDAIEQLLSIMKKSGVIILVVYHGHPEGKVEKEELLDFVSKIDQKQAQVFKYEFLNQVKASPFIIAIEKK